MSTMLSLESLSSIFSQIYTQSHIKLNKNFPEYLINRRKKALQIFKKKHLPNSKTEAYHHTPISKYLNTHFAQEVSLPIDHTTDSLRPKVLQKIDAYHLILYNGKIIPCASLLQKFPKNLHILPLSLAYTTYPRLINSYFTKLALSDQDSLIALNTMLFNQGGFIYLTPDTKLDKPLVIHHHTGSHVKNTTIHPRLLIVLGKNSKTQLIETFCPNVKSAIFINRVAEIALEPYAKLDYYHLQPKNLSPFLQMHYTHIYQRASSSLFHYSLTLDKYLTRNHLEVTLEEPQSKAKLYGMYIGCDTSYIENNTVIHHKAPYTTSHQLYKGLVQQKAQGIFRGNIHVQKAAQKTQANQKHHAWILDPKASIKTQPRLSIQADDVQCSHGATISQPDENQLFYLKTRGIPQNIAQNMLLQGFCKEMIDKVNLQSLKGYINQILL